MEHFLCGHLAPANKGLLAFLALGTLCRTALLTTGFDKRSRTTAIASARKLIAQHLDFSSQISQLPLKICVLCTQRSVLRYQFFAGLIVHISHLDNQRKILL
jgi:hypothetical protein